MATAKGALGGLTAGSKVGGAIGSFFGAGPIGAALGGALGAGIGALTKNKKKALQDQLAAVKRSQPKPGAFQQAYNRSMSNVAASTFGTAGLEDQKRAQDRAAQASSGATRAVTQQYGAMKRQAARRLEDQIAQEAAQEKAAIPAMFSQAAGIAENLGEDIRAKRAGNEEEAVGKAAGKNSLTKRAGGITGESAESGVQFKDSAPVIEEDDVSAGSGIQFKDSAPVIEEDGVSVTASRTDRDRPFRADRAESAQAMENRLIGDLRNQGEQGGTKRQISQNIAERQRLARAAVEQANAPGAVSRFFQNVEEDDIDIENMSDEDLLNSIQFK